MKKQKKLIVRTGVKAGALIANHAKTKLAIRTGVKAGGFPSLANNHAKTKLAIRTGVKAGALIANHSKSSL